MPSQWLPFITNADFMDVLSTLLEISKKAQEKAEKNFTRNVIDPFTALFQMVLLDIDSQKWKDVERNRQIEKSLQNHIGLFHQQLISKLNGWSDIQKKGTYDLVNHERMIIVEIKNKHNTVKKSDLIKVCNLLKTAVMDKGQTTRGYIAYLVEIIPKGKKRYDEPFTTTDNATGEKTPINAKIRRIDGASFYSLATGYTDALRLVFDAIPKGLNALGLTVDDKKIACALDYFNKSIGD